MGTIEFLYGIVLLSMIPVRYEPSERGEMVTQLLFGDTFTVVEKDGGWLHIRSDYDDYEGWVYERTVCLLNEHDYREVCDGNMAIVGSFHATLTEEGKAPINIVEGTSLPNYDGETKSVKIGNKTFYFAGELLTPTENVREAMATFGKTYLNTPYLWGGRSPYGIDCSGFSQQVAKLVGIRLPRDASQQVKVGKDVNFLEEAQIGDLAFFDNEEGKIIHVGMLLGENRIIHASGQVRIDSIDQEGIYNLDLGKYTHNLRAIKNVVDK